MAKYEIVVAIDVPCYKSVIVEADSAEEAKDKALKAADNDVAFEPEWDCAGPIRVACDPQECVIP